jgi:hypothetical protein
MLETLKQTETSPIFYFLFFSFVKQTEKQPTQIEFQSFSVEAENIFCFVSRTPNYCTAQYVPPHTCTMYIVPVSMYI